MTIVISMFRELIPEFVGIPFLIIILAFVVILLPIIIPVFVVSLSLMSIAMFISIIIMMVGAFPYGVPAPENATTN